jgi:hypothetical protein
VTGQKAGVAKEANEERHDGVSDLFDSDDRPKRMTRSIHIHHDSVDDLLVDDRPKRMTRSIHIHHDGVDDLTRLVSTWTSTPRK